MPEETIIHKDSKYKVVFERVASSTKQIDGFKVEANGDNMADTMADAESLYQEAIKTTETEVGK